MQIAIAVVEHQGKYLIGPRPPGVPLTGLWEFPGGKVQLGETPENAAVRECREEAGLEVTIVGRYPDVEHQYEHGRVSLAFFACQLVDISQQPIPPFQWVAAAHLGEYSFPAANRALVDSLKSL
ncbi:MAG TPA: (deoxy)nucleoside triphosphate pyrophosphohydrolase [Pirellulales bacterium]|nr:(deoxy)nucleoside triphosphate pyrophosphohydrolase [Pirellulales bacterium]